MLKSQPLSLGPFLQEFLSITCKVGTELNQSGNWFTYSQVNTVIQKQPALAFQLFDPNCCSSFLPCSAIWWKATEALTFYFPFYQLPTCQSWKQDLVQMYTLLLEEASRSETTILHYDKLVPSFCTWFVLEIQQVGFHFTTLYYGRLPCLCNCSCNVPLLLGYSRIGLLIKKLILFKLFYFNGKGAES